MSEERDKTLFEIGEDVGQYLADNEVYFFSILTKKDTDRVRLVSNLQAAIAARGMDAAQDIGEKLIAAYAISQAIMDDSIPIANLAPIIEEVAKQKLAAISVEGGMQ